MGLTIYEKICLILKFKIFQIYEKKKIRVAKVLKSEINQVNLHLLFDIAFVQ